MQGVNNYYVECEGTVEMHKYVIKKIFRELYLDVPIKPQVFVFFNSIDEINQFVQYFDSIVIVFQLF